MGATLLHKFVGMVAYPPGSIYITTHELDIQDLHEMWGGTWEAFAKGQTLIGVDPNDTDFHANTTGGSKAVTLPSHNHGLNDHTHGMAHSHSFTNPTITGGDATTTDGSGDLTASSEGAHTHTVSDYHPRSQSGASGSVWYTGMESDTRTTSSDGSHEHTIPSHTHGIPAHSHTAINGAVGTSTISTTGGCSTNTGDRGSDASKANLPPYITVFMYKRLTLY